MSWLPVGSFLGELEIVEVFVDYDGPRIFSCRSATEQSYIATWASEGDDHDLWLYAPVSPTRLTAVRSGGVKLRDAFLHAEGFVYLANLPHAGTDGDEVKTLAKSDILEDWLPDADFGLDIDTPTTDTAASPLELERTAVQEGRTRLDLRVHLPEYFRTEAPTRRIGGILLALQTVLDNFSALEIDDTPPQAGPLPSSITNAAASDLVSLTAASFVLGIASTDGQDLFGGSPFSSAVDHLVTLAGVALEDVELPASVSKLQPRGARSYRQLIRELSLTNGDVSITAGSPNFGSRIAKLSAEKLQQLTKLLEGITAQEPVEIRSRMVLFAANSNRKRFGLRDVETDVEYQGTVSEAADHQVSRATLGDEYDATLTEITTYEGATGESKFVYTLEQLVHVNGEPNDEPADALTAWRDSAPPQSAH
ncbi:DUF6575 domain-containing protein [Arthrobacter sp. H35-D1]|uniref:DUF6575 domain-containing protein n=1 Tax=Arthrobacter sp. H35-D1 TaxID=3046202 RepID=UPI0024BA71F6|nr:DUF6575 domain-containing protein [Arthrobacter sp. H35-D1]MDJ0315064.1 hypothetical protein [Arthrobacter sp. H35-D1]